MAVVSGERVARTGADAPLAQLGHLNRRSNAYTQIRSHAFTHNRALPACPHAAVMVGASRQWRASGGASVRTVCQCCGHSHRLCTRCSIVQQASMQAATHLGPGKARQAPGRSCVIQQRLVAQQVGRQLRRGRRHVLPAWHMGRGRGRGDGHDCVRRVKQGRAGRCVRCCDAIKLARAVTSVKRRGHLSVSTTTARSRGSWRQMRPRMGRKVRSARMTPPWPWSAM